MSWFQSNLPPNGNTGFTGTGGTPVSLDQGSSYAIGDGMTPQTGTGYLGGSPNFNEAGQYDGGSEGPGGISGTLERYNPSSPYYQPNLGPMIGPAGGGSTAPPSGNDPNAIRQWVIAKAQQSGRTDIANNPDYWVQQIQKVGGVGDGQYWGERISSGGGGGDQPGGGGGMGGFGAGLNSPLLAPYTKTFGDFNAPSGLDLANDPGYQARMKMGTDAIQNSAAAKGKLLTGGTLKDLTQYGQDFGSNEYSNVFNRALQGYNTNKDTFTTNYGIYRNNQNDPFNKLYSLSNLGFNAAEGANNAAGAYANNLGQNASLYNNVGQNYANQVGSTQIGQGNVNAGANVAQGNNTTGLVTQAGSYVTPEMVDWFKKHFSGAATAGDGGPTADAFS